MIRYKGHLYKRVDSEGFEIDKFYNSKIKPLLAELKSEESYVKSHLMFNVTSALQRVRDNGETLAKAEKTYKDAVKFQSLLHQLIVLSEKL